MTIRRSRFAMDMDTALEDGQWSKLQDFLSDKLEDDDMGTVEDICRRGGDAPERPMPGKDRKSGAADGAIQRYERHQAEVRDQHRRGLITDADLPRALQYGNITTPPKKPTATVYDAKSFPDLGRLK